MADNNFGEYPIKFLLAGLFLVAMLAFGIGIAHNYGQDDTLIKSDKIDFTHLEQQINSTSTDAKSWGDAFRSDNFFIALGNVVLFSVWGVAKLVWTAIITVFTLIIDGSSAVLGIPSMVTGVLLACLIIAVLFSAYKMIKTGE